MVEFNKEKVVKLLSYGAVGIVGTIVHVLILVLLVQLFHLDPVFSSSIGFVFTVLISFILNRRYTFRSSPGNISTTFVKYTIVSVSGFLLNTGIMYLIVHILSLYYLIGQAIVIVVLPISNFMLNNFWTFKEV